MSHLPLLQELGLEPRQEVLQEYQRTQDPEDPGKLLVRQTYLVFAELVATKVTVTSVTVGCTAEQNTPPCL